MSDQIEAPWWDDRTVFLVGGGPSLRGFDFSRLIGRGYVVGVNQAMLELPELCAGVSMDHRFIEHRRVEIGALAAFVPIYLATSKLAPIEDAIYLRHRAAAGLSDDPSEISRGSTSGYCALNIATLKRARRIVLLGYDYGETEHAHWHDAYPWHVRDANAQSWPVWAMQYEAAAEHCRKRGIEVINASPVSRIEAFPKCTVMEAM